MVFPGGWAFLMSEVSLWQGYQGEHCSITRCSFCLSRYLSVGFQEMHQEERERERERKSRAVLFQRPTNRADRARFVLAENVYGSVRRRPPNPKPPDPTPQIRVSTAPSPDAASACRDTCPDVCKSVFKSGCRANLEQTSQSRPDSGLGLSRLRYL